MTVDSSSAGATTASIVVKLRDVFAREVRGGDLLRGLIVIGPLVVVYFLSDEPALLDLDLIAISLLISAQKLQLPRRLVALQLFAILFTFIVLLLAALFFQAEDGIRDSEVTGVQTCALPI